METNKDVFFALLGELKAGLLQVESGRKLSAQELKAFTDGAIHTAKLLGVVDSDDIAAYMGSETLEVEDGYVDRGAASVPRPSSGPNLKNRLVEWAKANGTVVGKPPSSGYGVGSKKRKKKSVKRAPKNQANELPAPKFVKSGIVRKGPMNTKTSDWSKVK